MSESMSGIQSPDLHLTTQYFISPRANDGFSMKQSFLHFAHLLDGHLVTKLGDILDSIFIHSKLDYDGFAVWEESESEDEINISLSDYNFRLELKSIENYERENGKRIARRNSSAIIGTLQLLTIP